MVGEINWGILDPNAAAKAAGSFQQGQANALAMQQERQQQAANMLALQKQQRAMAEEDAINQAYAQSGGDVNKLADSLRGAGMHRQAMEIEGQMKAQQAAQRKAQIEEVLQHIQVMGQLAGGVKDQATHNQFKQQVASIYGPEAAAQIPDVYDPNQISQLQNQALSAKDNLEQQWKALDYGMKQNEFGLKQQQFGFEQSKFGQQQALERQKMGQAERHFQASQGLEREKLKAKGPESAKDAERIQTANDALDIIGEAESILGKGKATESYGGRLRDIAAQSVGVSTQGAQDAAQLKALAGALVSKMPKMSGPQSDKDVALYREMAGQIGDETMPIATRKAALKTVRKLQEKYAGKPASEAGAHPADIQDLLNKYGG